MVVAFRNWFEEGDVEDSVDFQGGWETESNRTAVNDFVHLIGTNLPGNKLSGLRLEGEVLR